MVSFIEDVCAALDGAVKRMVDGKDVAVAFSGGLDSGLVTAMASKYASNLKLYTVGYGESYDVRMSRDMARRLDLEWEYIPITEENLDVMIRRMISVTGTSSPLTLAFETPLFYVCDHCPEDLIIGGQGSDELFAGYSKYVGLKGTELRKAQEEDLQKLKGPTFDHESKVSTHFGKTILYPFLDEAVENVVKKIPVSELEPDTPDSRKRILKECAESLGYPFIADKQKKAAQYGSGMIDAMHKICRAKGITYTEYVDSIIKEL